MLRTIPAPIASSSDSCSLTGTDRGAAYLTGGGGRGRGEGREEGGGSGEEEDGTAVHLATLRGDPTEAPCQQHSLLCQGRLKACQASHSTRRSAAYPRQCWSVQDGMK
eukprot:2126531-Rhodomonas_salina.2